MSEVNTSNVGQVTGLFIGSYEPTNKNLIWYDDTPNQMCHKVYDYNTKSWVALNPVIVALTTYSEIVNNAKKNGLPVGKHYQITDKSNVLAVSISKTKIWYVDTLGNILVDDLGTNIQYHVSSSNLLIDDIKGVFNTNTKKLIFQFAESDPDYDNDYVFGKKKRGTSWFLSKFKLSSFISRNSDNAISWSGGFFFNFKSAISNILNKADGIVGYDKYNNEIDNLNISIRNISKENQNIAKNASSLVSKETSDDKIFSKKINKNIDISSEPSDVISGDTLFNILSKFQRWVNRFKYADGILITKNFSDAKSKQFINNNDTINSALQKIQYFLKNPTIVSNLPENWSTKTESGNYEAYEYDGLPVPGDTIFYAFAKIVSFLKNSSKNILITDWRDLSSSKPNGGFNVKNGDTLLTSINKIYENTKNINNGQLGLECVEYDNIVNVGVLQTDMVRFDIISKDASWFGEGCGIGGLVTKDNGDLNWGYFFQNDPSYPTDPYRLIIHDLYWGERAKWPQVLAFAPVIYFSESNSQNRYTNATPFIHVKEKIYLQFIVYISNAKLTKLKNAGKTNVSFLLQVDAYGYKTPQKEITKNLANVMIINISISKSIVEEYYDKSQHIVFYLTMNEIN